MEDLSDRLLTAVKEIRETDDAHIWEELAHIIEMWAGEISVMEDQLHSLQWIVRETPTMLDIQRYTVAEARVIELETEVKKLTHDCADSDYAHRWHHDRMKDLETAIQEFAAADDAYFNESTKAAYGRLSDAENELHRLAGVIEENEGNDE